jgi:hypothetical protein
VARHTGIYQDDRGQWISAFAPILDGSGRPAAVVAVDYDLYGKVVGVEPGDDGRAPRIHLTSVTDTDQKIIDSVLAVGRRAS